MHMKNKKTQGFTLIELLITVAIVGMIAVGAGVAWKQCQGEDRPTNGHSRSPEN